MALAAGNVFVSAFQGKGGAGLVIEKGGAPLDEIVTAITMGGFRISGELPRVGVLVTFLANRGGLSKVHVSERRFKIGRAVASGAFDGPVSADQSVASRVVVEADERAPGGLGMAGFAAGNRSVLPPRLHALGEFAAVRIGVAAGAGTVFKKVLHGRGGCPAHSGLVARVAGYSEVRLSEREAGFLVLGQREPDRLERLNGVAVLAAIPMRRAGELAAVDVFVAARAVRLLDHEHGVRTARDVALGAGHFYVPAFERVGCGGMQFHSEQGRFPRLLVVAFRAGDAGFARLELAAMRIGRMAILAQQVRRGEFEIRLAVALFAVQGLVLPGQGELRFGMVKFGEATDLAPGGSCVALLAGALEFAGVRITMACHAVGKRDAGVLDKLRRTFQGAMTLLAGQPLVRSSERVLGLCVAELFRALPTGHHVTAQAVLVELSVVRVRVAAQAIAR